MMSSSEIYLVVMEWEYDAERGVDIEAFTDISKAEEYYENLINTEKTTSWIKDINSLVVECEEHSYYAYDEDGEAQTHTRITLQKKPIK